MLSVVKLTKSIPGRWPMIKRERQSQGVTRDTTIRPFQKTCKTDQEKKLYIQFISPTNLHNKNSFQYTFKPYKEVVPFAAVL